MLSPALPKAALLVFVITNMLAMGMSLRLGEIVAPLRDRAFVLRALLTNIVLLPLVAWAIARLPGVEPSLGVALALLATAAGSPTLPKLIEMARGNLAIAVSATLLLMAATIASMPLTLPWLLPGVAVDALAIARTLVDYTLLPVVAGLMLRALREATAARLAPVFGRISSVSLAVAMALAPLAHFEEMKALMTSSAVVGGLGFILLATGLGWVAGGAGREARTVLCLGSGQRNVAAALVVATRNFTDPRVFATLVLITVASWLIIVPLARVFARDAIAQRQAGPRSIRPADVRRRGADFDKPRNLAKSATVE